MCDRLGISAWEVIEAAATKPFAFLAHYPGPGLGGDCIPVVPHFLAWRLREYGYSAQLIEAAHEVNARMPIYVVQKVGDALNDAGKPIKGVADPAARRGVQGGRRTTSRESPSFEVMRQLLQRGGDVVYCDPWVPDARARRRSSTRACEWSAEAVAGADCVVMLTPHGEFLEQPLWDQARADRRHAQRRPATGTTSSASESAHPRPGGRLHRRGAGGARARCRATTSRSPTTGTRPSRGQLEGLERARRAGRDRRHPRPQAAATSCSRERPGRVLLARRAGQPAALGARARLHRGDEPDRRAARRRGGGASWAAPARRTRSSLHVYGAALEGEVGPEHPYGAQGDLAHLSKIYAELCLAAVRERGRLRARHSSAGDRLRPEPGRARPPGVADRRRQVQAAGRRGRAADAGRRRPGHDRRRARRGRGADPARIAALSARRIENVVAETTDGGRRGGAARGGPRAGRQPRCTFSSPFEYHHRVAEYLR